MKYKIALLPVLLLLSLLSLAQTSTNLTLPAAIDLSIANSKYLHQNEVAIQKASAALTEAKQNRLPNATVSGSYLQLSQADVNLKLKNNNPWKGIRGTQFRSGVKIISFFAKQKSPQAGKCKIMLMLKRL